MGNKWRIALTLSLIVCFSWIELQYFSESVGVNETARKLAHILFLLAIMGTGYLAWMKSPIRWLRLVWLLAYGAATALILLIGLLQWKLNIFATGFLDVIRDIRLFFSSPLPFIMLLAAAMRFRSDRTSLSASTKE